MTGLNPSNERYFLDGKTIFLIYRYIYIHFIITFL